MSARERPRSSGRAVALSYDGGAGAPVVVASGMGYMAEKIVEVAAESGVPIYEDNSLATMLSQLSLGQEIPDSLYRAIVEIYVYFLNFDPADPDKAKRERQERERALREREELERKAKEQQELEAQQAAAAQAAAEKGEA